MPLSSDEVAKALGASRTIPLETQPAPPFGLLQLQAELSERLRSPAGAGAGRPSDPDWTIRRLVGFRPETWQALADIAAQTSTPRRRVSPGQVAAHLIEDGVARLRERTPSAAPPEPPDTDHRKARRPRRA